MATFSFLVQFDADPIEWARDTNRETTNPDELVDALGDELFYVVLDAVAEGLRDEVSEPVAESVNVRHA